MNQNSRKLICSRAINKVGNVLYDYGNSVWIASMGAVGQQFLGAYQLVEQLVSIILNPFGGAIADRFRRRQILLVTDAVCALVCFLVALISNDKLMLYALLMVNGVLALSSSFSSPANKSFITAVVPKEELVDYNATLEVVLKIISVSAPLLSFLLVKTASLQLTLFFDGISFALSFLLVWLIRVEEQLPAVRTFQWRKILADIWEGAVFIGREKDIFFLLMVASGVNIFIAGLNYLLPFTDSLYQQPGSYATILSMGAGGAICGALVSRKVPSTVMSLLISLALSGLGIVVLGLPLPLLVCQAGNFLFEFFLTIFNIHFFSQVQSRVPNAYLGRVFSSIFTLAILLMPLGTIIMTVLPHSVTWQSFIVIGVGMAIFALGSLVYARHSLK
ncbi:MFS transporter [Streptococcus caprae]|uniref:MFS transporter n=1 Tax=Streptococcus caprae TaxID=1640501 RepID=A0ABV8CSE9_9STRE